MYDKLQELRDLDHEAAEDELHRIVRRAENKGFAVGFAFAFVPWATLAVIYLCAR